MTLFRL